MPIRRGENHVNAKLTEEKVRAIKSKYQWFKVTQVQLAAEFGVSKACIQNVLSGKYWRHVQGCSDCSSERE